MLEFGQEIGCWVGNQKRDQSNNTCVKNGVKTHSQIGHIGRVKIGLVIGQSEIAMNIKERFEDNQGNWSEYKEKDP